ncbi:nucleotidyltransferase substrate binding protein [Paracraurococcus ruber]|uniref:Uncharacterized protein n=1 Tax=Paracraurococcus ruber TaxID=77675 RepID=A0ABS1D1Q3_9PROT|nr:nucleotidyltransferase substrate binding protein [Paracraurococcus ruber]MBK1660669.1 hypothetical protein [Paracraurococcus ruber]TDG32624.1 hypothetical protein E2C05_06430 [Paracraurococcus ruber]
MTEADLDAAIRAAQAIAQSLRRVRERLVALFPLDAAGVSALDEDQRDRTDALIKRFENLVNTLQDQVFRQIAERELARDPDRMSRRDVLDYMEKIGVLDAADRFLDAVKLRNRLSHVYPEDPAKQAGQLNRVHAATAVVLQALEGVEAWAARRLTPPASP